MVVYYNVKCSSSSAVSVLEFYVKDNVSKPTSKQRKRRSENESASDSAGANTTITDKDSKSKPYRAFHCDICGTSFTQKYNLNRHKGKCAGTRVFACQICGKKCYRSDALQHHIMAVHVTSEFGSNVGRI